VTEAMWKGTAVIGGRCGGIKHQIEDGVNGLLVSSVEQAADAIVKLLKDRALREKLGKAARQSVQKRFLMSRELEQQVDLASAFEACFTANQQRLAQLSLAALSESAASHGSNDES
jgi:trehalose synthase